MHMAPTKVPYLGSALSGMFVVVRGSSPEYVIKWTWCMMFKIWEDEVG